MHTSNYSGRIDHHPIHADTLRSFCSAVAFYLLNNLIRGVRGLSPLECAPGAGLDLNAISQGRSYVQDPHAVRNPSYINSTLSPTVTG